MKKQNTEEVGELNLMTEERGEGEEVKHNKYGMLLVFKQRCKPAEITITQL